MKIDNLKYFENHFKSNYKTDYIYFPLKLNVGYSLFGLVLQIPFVIGLLIFSVYLILESIIISTNFNFTFVKDWYTYLFFGFLLLLLAVYFSFKSIKPFTSSLRNNKNKKLGKNINGLHIGKLGIVFINKFRKEKYILWESINKIELCKISPPAGVRGISLQWGIIIEFNLKKSENILLMDYRNELDLSNITNQNSDKEKLEEILSIISKQINLSN